MRTWQFNLLRVCILIGCGVVAVAIVLTQAAFLGIDKAALFVMGILTGIGVMLLIVALLLSGSVSTRS
jgi:hypothetical protein